MTAALESYYAAIYQHGAGVTDPDIRPALARFLAVLSNLYRSFVNRNKRNAVNAPPVPLVTEIPPLAFFQSDGGQGPYTITSDDTQLNNLGTNVGIVSLPATYRNDPIIWASLTHEVCGHDVVHADAKLVPELVATVRAHFAPHFNPSGNVNGGNLQALVWSYWMDEAVADAYGVLNMGPTFPFNLAAFLASLSAKYEVVLGHQPRPPKPLLRTDAGPRDPNHGDNDMDEHPVDVLRLYLAIGVIESLSKLSAQRRSDYVESTERIAIATANGATQVRLEGLVKVDHDHYVQVDAALPFDEAANAAREVGRLIATGKFAALNGLSIQDIETWDNSDEDTASSVKDRILGGASIVRAGDDAQLLAGATMAVVERPDLYNSATKLLTDALDDSYRRDPIWGGGGVDHMFAPARLQFGQPQSMPAGKRAGRRPKVKGSKAK